MKRLEQFLETDEIKIESFVGKSEEFAIKVQKSGFSWGVGGKLKDAKKEEKISVEKVMVIKDI